MTPDQIEDELVHAVLHGNSTQEQTYNICFWLKEIALQLAWMNTANRRDEER
jgi:hypothetical protein